MIARVACPKVIIALGGNIESAVGPPASTLAAALESLGDSFLTVEAVSPFFATPCFPAGAGPDYVNAAAVLSGSDDPQAVLDVLHSTEAVFGRSRRQRWGQRTLDLDLISLGDVVLPDLKTYLSWRDLPPDRRIETVPDRLILPHPRLQDRAFVLIPLAHVAPDWRHPVTGLGAAEMADALPQVEKSAIKQL
ncbi:MAG: 2-amino-4-hydroxy-6-hydroxymethyldihydropteridine diphosphokinase [Rhodobacter sp.]|nr:2-amino-4-hydroxy-6-hydroxymethyldihydropteridine diphosphokinase [Rhodobacter sp.]